MGFSNRFAVPACTLRVQLVEEAVVGFAGPGEGVGEFGLADFVIVVGELFS